MLSLLLLYAIFADLSSLFFTLSSQAPECDRPQFPHNITGAAAADLNQIQQHSAVLRGHLSLIHIFAGLEAGVDDFGQIHVIPIGQVVLDPAA